MSAQYRPVGWTRSKIAYDAVLLTSVFLYLFAFIRLAPGMRAGGTALDAQSVAIRAYGSCAFLLLTLVLSIGPLARLDRRFLPLLYNRRHFGVITCAVALAHAKAVLDWYFAYSPLDPLVAMLVSDAAYGSLRSFPFIPFGLAALAILLLLAATSHDFWLSFLTPPVWKALHMAIYIAFALVVMHVAFGAMQDMRQIAFPALVIASAASLTGLHLAAAWRGRASARTVTTTSIGDDAWLDAAAIDDLADGRGIVVPAGEGEVAIFRDGQRLYAIANACAHQNGPLGEGRVLDGKVICPWHGYEYRLVDGCAPPPFTERVPTHRLCLAGRRVLLDPRPGPPGESSAPVILPDDAA